MIEKVVSHVYRLKRGQESAVIKANPILQPGEPIVVWCEDGTTKLKIGDGTTSYIDLPWVGEDCVYNAPTVLDFPNVGKSNVIYKAQQTKLLYQWNPETCAYETLGNGSISPGEITCDDIIDFEERTSTIVENTIGTELDNIVEDYFDNIGAISGGDVDSL